MLRAHYIRRVVLTLLLLLLAGGAAYAAKGDVYVLLDASTLRQGPGSSNSPVSFADQGDKAEVLRVQGQWTRVRMLKNGDVGWVYTDALQSSVSAAKKPASGSGQIAAKKAAATAVAAESVASTSPAVAADALFVDGAVSQQRSVAAQPIAPDAAAMRTVASTSVVRDGPDSSGGVLGWVSGGAAVEVLDQQNSWLKVRMLENDRTGWIEQAALNETAAPVQEPAVAHAASDVAGKPDTVQPAAAQAVAMAPAPVVEKTVAAAVQAEPVAVQLADNAVPERAAVGVTGPASAAKAEVAQTQAVAVEPTAIQAAAAPEQIATVTSAEPEQPLIDLNALVQKNVAPDPVIAAEPAVKLLRFSQNANIRAGPDKSFDTIAWAGHDALAAELERKGDWVRIKMQESQRQGWVYDGSLVALAQPAEASTVIAPVAEQPVSDPAVTDQTAAAAMVSTQPAVDVAASAPAVDMPVADATTTKQAAAASADASTVAQASDTVPAGQVRASAAMDQGAVGQPVTASAVKLPVEQATADQATVNKAPVSAPAAVEPVQSAQAASDLRRIASTTQMRTGPGTDFSTMGWAAGGVVVQAIEQQGAWYKVSLQKNGRIGWVASKALLRMAGSAVDMSTAAPAVAHTTAAQTPAADAALANAPAAEHVAAAPAPAAAEQAVLNTGQQLATQDKQAAAKSQAGTTAPSTGLLAFNRKSNLRAGPAVSFDTVSWAGAGAYANALERRGEWVKVQMLVSKRLGWVDSRALDAVTDVTASTSSVLAAEPAQASLITATAVDPADLYLFKQTSNLRAGPGKQFDVVHWGGKNETAAVIDQQGDWRKVRMTMSAKEGWVFHDMLARAVLPAVATPAVAAVRPTKTDAVLYKVMRTEPLRADALAFAELTGWVSKGDQVTLLEKRQGWMRVSPEQGDKAAGWMKADYLQALSAPKQLATVTKKKRVSYADRISKGETFNFSYAALEGALYRIPVEDIDIRVHKEDLTALFRKDLYDKSSFEIRLKIGRRNLKGRVKVLGSSTRIFKKKSIRIKLDKDSGRSYGRRNIALRSMASDKALMREWMAWKLLAAMGLKVPEVHFARVHFNKGEMSGLYLSIEWMGRQFLDTNGLDAKGGFYQPNDASHCGDLSTSQNLELCFDKITPRDDDYSALSAMAKAVIDAPIDKMDSVLAQYFDDESVLNWIVANGLVSNGDTYNKNYWLNYSLKKKKWTVIPWDYNLTFGRVYDPFETRAFRIFNDNFQYFYPPDIGAGSPLKEKSLRNPRLRARIESKIKHLLGMEPNGPEQTFGWFSPTVMHARIGNLAKVVGKEVYKDTFLDYGEGEFTKTYESLMHFVTAHDHFLKVKLFGKYHWDPAPPFDPEKPFVQAPLPDDLYGQGVIDAGGESLHMTDQGWGYFVARLNLKQPVKKKTAFKVHMLGGTPEQLPVGQSPRRCIARTWLISTETPGVAVTGDLMLEYVQENSQRTDVPVTIHEELLELWEQNGQHWVPLVTEVNEYANTLIAKDVQLKGGESRRFVACSPF